MRTRITTPVLSAAATVVAGLAVVIAAGAAAATEPTPTSLAGAIDHRWCERDLEAVRAVPDRVRAAWEHNDADTFADLFTPDVHFIVPDGTYLRGRHELRSYMARNFAGPAAGTRVTVEVLSARCVSRDVAVVTTTGGILLPAEIEVPPERVGIQTWVILEHDGGWLTTAYENARIN